jgi:hypothetical protein
MSGQLNNHTKFDHYHDLSRFTRFRIVKQRIILSL